MSSRRGIPSLNPYSYHFSVGKSGYFVSRAPHGPEAPRSACAPASICKDNETTNRAPPGQKLLRVRKGDFPPLCPGACALAAPIAKPSAVLPFIKRRRSIWPPASVLLRTCEVE